MTETQLTVVRIVAFGTALLAGLLVYFGSRVGALDFKPGGASFDAYVRPAFLAVLITGSVVALRWELVGGCIAAFAAAALIGFATNYSSKPATPSWWSPPSRSRPSCGSSSTSTTCRGR